MATLLISEYAALGRDKNGNLVPVGQEPATTTQSVTFTVSTQSAAFDNATRFVRVVADAKAHLSFGTAPTATVNSPYIAADAPEYFGVIAGQKVAAYDGVS